MANEAVIEEFKNLMAATDKEKPKKADLIALENLLSDNPELWRAIDLAQITALQAIENPDPSP